ncbi:MAG: hypothetical protein HPAVJP_5810 [Candidatus Hepatoplasma vulgare]|nr:MAG: hypothetical protein HPAVJP_5810 [Candidatus Hepatoplasma sp.]
MIFVEYNQLRHYYIIIFNMNKFFLKFKNFFENKKKIYWIIFAISAFGVIFSILGCIHNAWGTNVEYFYYFFTYQTNTLVAIFYLLIAINVNYKYKKLNFVHNEKLKVAIATYMGLLILTVFLLMIPLEIFQSFGLGKGATTTFNNNYDMSGNWYYYFGNIIKNLIIHLIVPLLVIGEIFFSNNSETKFSAPLFWTIAVYPVIYLINAFLIGYFTGIYPYAIFNTNLYDVWLVIIFIFIEVLFYSMGYFISLRRTKNYKNQNIKNKVNL